jgi:hypothetical protein
MILVVGHNKWTWDWPLFIMLPGRVMPLKSMATDFRSSSSLGYRGAGTTAGRVPALAGPTALGLPRH